MHNSQWLWALKNLKIPMFNTPGSHKRVKMANKLLWNGIISTYGLHNFCQTEPHDFKASPLSLAILPLSYEPKIRHSETSRGVPKGLIEVSEMLLLYNNNTIFIFPVEGRFGWELLHQIDWLAQWKNMVKKFSRSHGC